MSWLENMEAFKCKGFVKMTFHLTQRLLGWVFFLKSHIIRTLVTKGAQNHFKYIIMGPTEPELVPFSKINN